MSIADENLHLLKNGPLAIGSFDDHLNHIKHHTDYLHNYFMGKDSEKRFKDHIKEHENALANINTTIAYSPVRTNPSPSVLKFSIGDRVKYRTSNEWGVILNMYKSPDTTYFTVKWDSDGLTQDFDINSIDNYLELANQGYNHIHPAVSSVIGSGNWTEPLAPISDQIQYQKLKQMNCCSDHKNQAIYTNFYDKKVKYCQKCGNELK